MERFREKCSWIGEEGEGGGGERGGCFVGMVDGGGAGGGSMGKVHGEDPWGGFTGRVHGEVPSSASSP